MTSTDDPRFERAIAAIDRANADDPHLIELRGERVPKELTHAVLASEWVGRLTPTPSEELRLAARAHHLRRWSLPRSDFPEGRKGYLVWRQALKQRHADEAAQILASCGYDDAFVERVTRTILRKNLEHPDAQILEDALCLVFFETQLGDLATQLGEEKTRSVGIKTLRKMSPGAREAALELPIDSAYIELLRQLCATL